MKREDIRFDTVALQGLLTYSTHFQIPEYQRNYSWTADEVGEFLKDIGGATDLNLGKQQKDASLQEKVIDENDEYQNESYINPGPQPQNHAKDYKKMNSQIGK